MRADLIKVDVIAFAGHKTLYGPLGIGGFINVSNVPLDVFISGGTGTDSLNLEMPEGRENRYESASANIVAISGLNAALKVLDQQKIYAHEKELLDYAYDKLSRIDEIRICMPQKHEQYVGIISFIVSGFNSEDIGMILDEDFDIAVRTGYHCAPYIHKYLNDRLSLGTVRIGFGQFTTKEEIDKLVAAIIDIVGGN